MKKMHITSKQAEILEVLRVKSKETVCGLRIRDIVSLVGDSCNLHESTAYRAIEKFRKAGIINPVTETVASGDNEPKMLYAVNLQAPVTLVPGNKPQKKATATAGIPEVLREIKRGFRQKKQELKTLKQEKREIEKKISQTQKELTWIEKYIQSGEKILK